MPDISTIHIDRALTNVSIGYVNETYVADDVMPPIPVVKRSDKYFIYNKDAFLRSTGVDPQGRPQSIRRPGSESTNIQFGISNQSFYAEQLAKKYLLTDAEVNYADVPLQPAIDATLALSEMIKLDNELAVATKCGKVTNYAASNQKLLVTGTTTWQATGSASHPMSVDIPGAKTQVLKGVLRTANAMLVNYATGQVLSQNPEYVDRYKYVSKEGVTNSGLLPNIEGLDVIEAPTQYVTSAEGVNPVTTAFAWTDNSNRDIALIFHRPPGVAGLRTVAFGLTFNAPDDTLGGIGYMVKRWREERLDGEYIEVRTTRDWRFICTDGSANGDGGNGYAMGGFLISGTTL